MDKFNINQIELWHKEYIKCYSFSKVARIFGVDCSTVKRYLIKYKDTLNIVLKEDLKTLNLKFCVLCKMVKNTKDFGISNKSKDGIHYSCLECSNERSRKYRLNNLEKARESSRKGSSKWRLNNLEKAKLRGRNSESKRRVKIKENNILNNLNPYADLEKIKKCYKCKNIKYVVSYSRDIGKTDGLADFCKNCNTEYKQNLRKNDINYKLADLLRTRIRSAIKNNQKAGSAVSDLGCSIQEAKQYLESKFYHHPITGERMTWDNRGLYGWHIDHIIPLISFDLSDREQFLKACHYTNLQPLWSEDNLSKGGKLL